MSSQNPLEYDEEEDPIFGPSDEIDDGGVEAINPAEPIASSSHQTQEDLRASYNARGRAEELRKLKVPSPFVHEGLGPISLKQTAQWVAKRNARNITHIGYLPYKDIGDVINEVPMKQITVIEENSPHIKKETDWLWESFLLQDYPIYHEQCWLKKGERRTSGWRRMYQKAKEELEERKARIARVASESSKKIQEDRAAHQIGTTTRSFPTNKVRKTPHNVQSHLSSGKPAAAPPTAVSKAIAAARKETQRARIAMTHASGFVSSVPSSSRPREKVTEEQLFRVPTTSSSAPKATPHPLAPPRSNLIPSSSGSTLAPKGSSLRALPKAGPMEIRKAEVPSFSIPKDAPPKRTLMDAFGGAASSVAAEKRSRPSIPALQTKGSSAPRLQPSSSLPRPSTTNGITRSTQPSAQPHVPPPAASNGLFIPKKKKPLPPKTAIAKS